ncbi:MAG TPA: hypothetical protein VF796_04985 [Humisphaera sp.]
MFAKLFKKPSSPAAARRPHAAIARPAVEPLEARELFSVTANVEGGNLIVRGDDQYNTINIDHAGSTTYVNGKPTADAAFNEIYVYTGGQPDMFSAHEKVNVLATARDVYVYGQGGGFITLPASLDVKIGKAGRTAGVVGDVFVHNAAFGGRITVDDSANPNPRNAAIDYRVATGFVFGMTGGGSVTFDADFADYLDVKTGTGNDTVTVHRTHPSVTQLFRTFDSITTVDTGAGSDTVRVERTNAHGDLFIEGHSGTDSVVLGEDGWTDGIDGRVSVVNTGGFTNLQIDDSADDAPRTVKMYKGTTGFEADMYVVAGLTDQPVLYAASDTNLLYVRGGTAGNKFDVSDTFTANSLSSGSNTIIETGHGNDTVTVRRTTGRLFVNGVAGIDVVKVSNNGSAQGIKNAVEVSNPFGLTTLMVDDTGATLPRNVTLDADVNPADATKAMGRINGIAPAQISYRLNDVKLLAVSTGSGNDSFYVHATQVRTETLLNGGKGGDQFFVGSQGDTMDTIQRKVTVNGQDGGDLLWIFDKKAVGAHTYTTFADRFERSGAVPVYFASIEGLEVQKGALVGNPPMAKNLTFPAAAKLGQTVTMAGQLVDPDAADKLTLTIDWGDGSKPLAAMPGRAPFAFKHAYGKKGTFVARVIWTDSTKQSNFRELKIGVN